MARIECNFSSRTVGGNVSVEVIIPSMNFGDMMTGKTDEELYGTRFPVLWLLHGTSGDHTDWLRYTCVERWAEENKIAVVTPAVKMSAYTDMAKGPAYFTYMTEELPAILQHMFPISDKREDNYIAGLSMGGYGATKLGLRRPDLYSMVIELSGGLDRVSMCEDMLRKEQAGEDVHGGLHNIDSLRATFGEDLSKVRGSENDCFHLAETFDTENKPMPTFYMACGTEDFGFGVNVKMRDLLIKKGFDVIWEQGPGGHTWIFWNEYLERAFKWIVKQRNQ